MKISIITATFNSEKTIKDTIDSVLSQTYEDFEHIIIDGLSSDKTIEIIKGYEEQYNGRLKILSEKDNGLYFAMNKGISLATGDVVGILNSDDKLASENSLELIAEKFSSEDCDGVYSDLKFMDAETMSTTVRTWVSPAGNYKLGWHPAHPTLYVKREVYQKLGKFNTDFRIAADYDFMLRLMKSNAKLLYINKTLVYMRAGGVSTDGLGGYVKNLKESHRVLKHNKIRFALFVDFIRIMKTILQFLKSK